MPNNQRRRALQAEWDRCPLINKKARREQGIDVMKLSSSETKDIILYEATTAYSAENFVKYLRKFEDDLSAASKMTRGDH